MFEKLKAPEQVVACRFSGTMTKQDVAEYKTLLDQKLGQHEHIGVCIDMNDLQDFSAKSMVIGTKADLDLFRHQRQVTRLAMVADQTWLHLVLHLAKPFMITSELRIFPAGERDKALLWVSE